MDMERNVQQYLHLYLGAECIIGDRNWKSQNILPNDLAPYTDPEFGKPIRSKIDLHVIQAFGHKVTLILRPLSDMTEEEKTEAAKILTFYQGMTILNEEHFNIRHDINKNMVYTALTTANENYDDRLGPSAYFQITPYLLSRSFDLFNLIPDGLAIDSTTLKTQQ